MFIRLYIIFIGRSGDMALIYIYIYIYIFIYIYIDNKPTMPVNAEKYFYNPPCDSNSRPRKHRLALHYPSSLPTARDNPKKDCSNSADIGIG